MFLLMGLSGDWGSYREVTEVTEDLWVDGARRRAIMFGESMAPISGFFQDRPRNSKFLLKHAKKPLVKGPRAIGK